MENQKHGGMFGMGEPNTAYAQYFVGNSYLNRKIDKLCAQINICVERLIDLQNSAKEGK